MAMLQTATVQVPRPLGEGQPDLLIEAYLARPDGAGPYPAILVIQEVFGVNAHIRDVCDRLAQLGYVALAPALYQRHAPGFEVGYTEAGLKEGRRYKEMTDAEELLGDLTAAIAYLHQLPPVKSPIQSGVVGAGGVGAGGVGVIGFCFGGHVAYLAATLPAVTATASFYGAGITTMTPGAGEPPTLTRTGQIGGTLYGFFGLEDDLIPNGQVDEIEAALRAKGVEHKIFRYEGAGHGFFCDGRSAYRAEAAAQAWEQVQELFQRCL